MSTTCPTGIPPELKTTDCDGQPIKPKYFTLKKYLETELQTLPIPAQHLLFAHFDSLAPITKLDTSRVKRIGWKREKKIIPNDRKFWKAMEKKINDLKLPFLEGIKFV